MSVDPVRAIADAVLYEGYILWPYRRSATKNRQRWTFGGVYPRAHSEGRDDDPWTMQTDCLVEGGADTEVEVRVRFLQVVERQLLEETAHGLEPVDQLAVGDELLLSWEEAREREVAVPVIRPHSPESPRVAAVEVPEGTEHEELTDAAGARVGATARAWRPLRGSVTTSSTALRPGLFRLRIRIANESPWKGADREDALKQTFASAHTVLRVKGGAFVSLTDPPEELLDEVASCRNQGTWPVLVGEPGDRSTLLSAPIILEDYAQIAPESPGDLFDGGEIDQLLTLNILGLTDEEKREMRGTDPRAREILERTENLSPEELMGLHGRFRELQSVRRS
ncbi:MAG: Uncharacterized protein MSMEG_2715 [uncultured Solirubrobacterales bacterium]|uniref:Uncharacterized protein MSMEG_2715 n=1 Tax=uncultured Solirubrobacterales bacterium TaxID=768556 RepID=A0A6J4RTH5_9ACTN|nr:MAG: Uncharacterized protein MSMEG_2715 [uncultured Solirubrobacterales bacterium]